MSILAHIRIEPLPGHGVVICLHHHYCLQPKGVWQHFSAKHADHTSVKDRQALQEYVDAKIKDLHPELKDIRVPTEPCPMIPGLQLYRDSAKCKTCGYICTGKSAVENMKGHLRAKHDIYAPAITNNQERSAWWRGYWQVVCCQQYVARDPHMSAGQNTAFFEVFEVDDSAEGEITTATLENTEQSADTDIGRHSHDSTSVVDPALVGITELEAQLIAAEKMLAEEQKAANAVIPSAPDRQTHPYLEHTQFQRCVADMPWPVIQEYTRPTIISKLQFLQDVVRSTMLVYQHRVSITPRWVRIRVMQEHLQHIPTTPLLPYQGFDNRHSTTILSIFTFFYQVFNNKVPTPPTFNVTDYQTSVWKRIELSLVQLHPKYPKVDTKHKRTYMEPLESLCHDFWISLLEQTTLQSDFHLAIVTPLAFVAVDTKNQKFREAYNFATDCSAVKKYARFAACWKWHSEELSAQDNESPNSAIWDELDIQGPEAEQLIKEQEKEKLKHLASEDAARTRSDLLKDWIMRYLTSEYPTAMSWVITTAHYIAQFRYGETLDAFVRWNGETVTVRHITTSFKQYVAMVWGLFHRAEALIAQLAFVDKTGDLPEIPWESIQCDPGNNSPGYTPFAPTQAALKHGEGFVRQQILRARLENTHKNTRIDNLDNFHQVQRYSAQVQDLLWLLFQLVHFTSGQPGRITEVLSILIQNSLSDGNRNIFMFQGMIAVVPRYHKGYNRDKSLKIVYRFLPREVGSILVWYLWLIRPFYATVSAGQKGLTQTPHFHQARSNFLWSNKSGSQYATSATAATIMKETTKLYLGEIVGPSVMRHLMITFGRHSKDSNVKIQALSPEEVEEAFQDVYNDAVERQANHTPNTGVALYASETAAIFRSRNNMAQSHFKVSTDWHRNLGFKSLPDHQSERKDLACSQPQVTHNVNLKILLVETFGRSAKFRGKQRMVLESIMDGEPAVAYIAGTGSGKSLAFLLPACYDGYGQTIVVAPLVAVRIDLHQRCEQLSLITSVFGAQDFNETARVIFAMPEHLASSRFQALVHRLRDMGRLERIVLDEFHYVLMDDHEYRPQLLAIRELAQFATPITLLSATVPPVSQAEAFRLLGLSSTVRVFREPTVRKNIRYQVDSTYAKKHFGIDDMAAYVRTQQEIHQKILVYVAHANSAEELARKLGAMCYHGQLSEQARTGVQANFTTAIQAVLVATIAFNAGVDVPDIGRVVRFGEPDHPLTYLQESGRGGRDGRVCIATIVLGRGIPTYLHKQLPTVRSVIEDIVQRGTLQSGCLRVPIDRYIDGDNTRTCCRGDEEPCGFCASLQDTVTSASSHKGTYTSSVMDTPQQSNATCSEPFTPATNLQVGVDDLSLDKLPSVPSVSEQRLMSMRNTDPNSILTPRLGFEATPSPHTPRRESWSQAAQHKRMRSQSSTLSHDMSSPMRQAEHESIKKAKIRRTLLFNQEHALNRRKQTSRILEELKQTATWWTENCVKCYADEEEFDHPKTECPKFTKDVVKHFRQHKLKGKLPKGQCYWCSLPMSLCAKWIDATSGVTKDRPDKTVECTFPHAILDAWACLWEYSPTIRENWKKRIVEETSGEIHGETDEEFAAYFTGTIPMPGEKPLGRIAYDVNWITQGYIRQLKDT